MVIEPEKGAFPEKQAERDLFMDSLHELARANAMTATIDVFFFEHHFPVDVRHNAKIHRLTLAQKYREGKL